MKIFVAGATGAVGKRLVPQLVAAGHDVVGTTRSTAKLDEIRTLGGRPVVMDGLDAESVGEAVARAEPDVIVHEMTALAGLNDLRHFDRMFATTNELRTAGTDHLLAAAAATGVRRFVAQSYAGWPSGRGDRLTTEDEPLDDGDVPAAQRESHAAIRHLEGAVTGAPLDGLVLRYGSLYGPGASDELAEAVRNRKLPLVGSGAGVWSWLHVDDAASATVAAVGRGAPGVFNVVDDEPAPVSEWLPYLATALRAKPPLRVPTWFGRIAAGEVAVSMMTSIRGAANAKAKRELDWQPRWASWRDGFVHGLDDDVVSETRQAA